MEAVATELKTDHVEVMLLADTFSLQLCSINATSCTAKKEES